MKTLLARRERLARLLGRKLEPPVVTSRSSKKYCAPTASTAHSAHWSSPAHRDVTER